MIQCADRSADSASLLPVGIGASIAVASIKGSIFGKVVDDLKKLAERDEAVKAALLERLPEDELELLEHSITAASLYSIDTYSAFSRYCPATF